MRAFQITTHCLDTTARRKDIKEKVNVEGLGRVLGGYLGWTTRLGSVFDLDNWHNR